MGAMKIISGGQSGADRAALDVAIERGLDWGGWCPKGGWAEDFPEPPGLLAKYPHLKETEHSHPLQRTEWNVRDSNASLILTDKEGLAPSIGTARALQWARQHGKPFLVLDATDPTAPARAAAWLKQLTHRFGPELTLGVGGPRESEAPGIYQLAKNLLTATLNLQH
jgi:Circularly permutated YpsA SLOG family